MTLLEVFNEVSVKPQNIKELRDFILDLAVRGKLTEKWRLENPLEPIQLFTRAIQEDKQRILVSSGIKKSKPLKFTSAITIDIPSNWEWFKFDDLAYISRGGSPRPIKDYLTEDPNGINWIKIGDTRKGERYITATKEKIILAGVNSSKKVFPGDFLLTNSMSFGRPYITEIEGCVHDGWLVIRPINFLNKDFLFNVLSSRYMKKEFKDTASGAVVKNLNIEKVRCANIPLPPIEEQKEIVRVVNSLMSLCDQLEEAVTLKEEQVTLLMKSCVAEALA